MKRLKATFHKLLLDQQMEGEAAWRLMLQHSWQRLEQKVLCKLLCVSQHMGALVHSTCAGRLSISVLSYSIKDATYDRMTCKRAKQLRQWLIKHQQLVCELVLQSPALLEGPRHSSVTAVALRPQKPTEALSAVRRPLTWCRQLLTTPVPTCPGRLVQLGHITASTALNHLTRLEWTVSSSSKYGTFIKSLKQLPALRVLALSCFDSGTGPAAVDHLAPALQSLSTLTALQLQHFTVSTASSSMLPPSLQTLILGPPLPRLFQRATRDQHLHLQHLTRLQHLQLHTLKACDLLPAQLTSLDVHLCSVRPLLRLQHLQQLSITGHVPESVLAQLVELTQLQQLQLGPCSTAALSPAGIDCLQQLPVCEQQLPVLSVLPNMLLQLQPLEDSSTTTTTSSSFSSSRGLGRGAYVSSSGSNTSSSGGSRASSNGVTRTSGSSTYLPDKLAEPLQQQTQEASNTAPQLHAGAAAGARAASLTPPVWPCAGEISAPEPDSDKVCNTVGAACISIVVHSE